MLQSSRTPLNSEDSTSSDSESSVSSGDTAMSENVTAHAQPINQDDACCIFCSENYSNDQQGTWIETWIQCQLCRLWANIECTGCDAEYNICDFCIIYFIVVIWNPGSIIPASALRTHFIFPIKQFLSYNELFYFIN